MARIMTITHSGMTLEAIEELISRRVEEALAAQEANHNVELIDENQSQNRHDNDNGSKGNGNHGNNNGDGNQNEGNRDARGNAPVARVCTYKDFLNCQPRKFSGTKGVVGLARWFEKMESVLRISNCLPNSQVKFATCTFLDGALTWWNSHVQTISIDEAYEMSWKDLMKLMIKVYCPRNEIQKLQNELWNLCVKGTDVAGYMRRFWELALLCPRMVPEENDKIERMANGLMDQKVYVYAARNAEQKRRFDNNLRGNRVQQPPFKRLHHEGPCTVKCTNCKKVGHMDKDYKTNVAAQAPRAPVANQRVVTCFGCGGQGHYKSNYPKLKNQNHGNKAANNDSRGRAYALGGGDGNPGSNVVIGTFLLNNHHAYILFDSGADRSFVSTTFSTFIDIPPTALDISYTVELADGRITKSGTIIRGCTLNLLDHPFILT
ncbi:reverse transcriptase domain-containing protein [Tanacetum coccineum]